MDETKELLKAILGRLEETSADIKLLKEDVKSLKEDITSIKEDVKSLKDGQLEIKDRLSRIEMRLDFQRIRLAKTQKKLRSLKSLLGFKAVPTVIFSNL
ncbi:hypothetical protein [Effusibacillus dendaii]|uniref:Uncharacterized protein n=1 Tax=Effusibacillus dendaii TaxID=2743772 RepID=A0A7I8DEN7_9BACL|nr:hypothetical protein [Effusibacillus dendaii]BCJ87752.1 hypothetical protein skT53_27370 [Effusibacillus dendaii]